MSDQFLHGIEYQEVNTGSRTVTTTRMNTIYVCGTAPGADADTFPFNKNVLIPGTASMIAALGTTGTLAMTMKVIDNENDSLPIVIVCRVEEGADDNETMANIIGGIDADSGEYTGIKRAVLAEQDTTLKPRIMIAPYFSQNKPVMDALITAAEGVRAIVWGDAENEATTKFTDAISYMGQFSSRRANIVYPWSTVYDSDVADYIDVPSSILAAVAEAQTNYYESSSMTVLNTVQGISKPVTFAEGNADTIANLLNEAGVTTLVQQKGWRLYGNRTGSSDTTWRYRAHVRLDDSIADALVLAHVWAKDKNIKRTYADEVLRLITSYLDYLASSAVEAIAGGKAWLDPELNTVDAMVNNGRVYFDFDYGRFGIAENIILRRHLNNSYVEEVLF